MTSHSTVPPPTSRVPVGFRFHPTDEELVGYYLPKKVAAKQIDLDLIKELDLYKVEPWDLQELCKIPDTNEKQTDYYFFSRKDKKYPTGNRANRATTAGFWKATGRDKAIYTNKVQQLIGMRKTLVFYEGRAPHGNKTDWIMHEFRLDDGPGMPTQDDGGWVVCRVFKKTKNFKMKTEERAVSFEGQFGLMPESIMGSPEILSEAGSSYPLAPCKQEICTQLDSYNNVDSSCSGHDPFMNASSHLQAQFGMNKFQESHYAMHPLSSAYNFKGGLSTGRRKQQQLDSTGFFSEQYNAALENTDHHNVSTAGTLFADASAAAARCNDNNPGGSEAGFPALDDWATVYESTGSGCRAADISSFRLPATTARAAAADQSLPGDIHILLQLKRQNSDLLFPSSCEFDLWNFNQMYQK